MCEHRGCHYIAELGLVIAKDKTIISTLNFTFINWFFSQKQKSAGHYRIHKGSYR